MPSRKFVQILFLEQERNDCIVAGHLVEGPRDQLANRLKVLLCRPCECAVLTEVLHLLFHMKSMS